LLVGKGVTIFNINNAVSSVGLPADKERNVRTVWLNLAYGVGEPGRGGVGGVSLHVLLRKYKSK
jgi:hypothetical protein